MGQSVTVGNNGRLQCSYRTLEQALGRPVRYDLQADWESSDQKVRAQWSGSIQGTRAAWEIYDYKQGRVPVEQVKEWSFRCTDEATRVKLLERLNAVDLEKLPPGAPSVLDVFDVEKWLAVHPRLDFDAQPDLPYVVRHMDWPKQEEYTTWVGLVKHWAVQRIVEPDGRANVIFWDVETLKAVAAFGLSRLW